MIRWEHLKAFVEMRSPIGLYWWVRKRRSLPLGLPCLREALDNPNIDNHANSEVVIAGDERVTMSIFEADPRKRFSVKAKEIFDGANDVLGSIVRVDLDGHWQARSVMRVSIEE